MCGIAGAVDFVHEQDDGHDPFSAMLSLLKRRGPDQDGRYDSSFVHLVHARLSVVDLETGIQPMIYTANGREYCIVYNGELYNTEEIRSQLHSRGYTFHGHSDTEVLLYAYVEWGANCVQMLNGIFGFAVWDKQTETLFIARDRIGVKPLFYALIDNVFIFASEIKALLQHPLVKPRIDVHSIAEIMLIGPGRTPGYGVFQHVEEVRPGYCGSYSRDGLHLAPYWELQDKEHTDTFEQTVETVRYLVTDSIERQLVSDVPVCTFLSGGLDSSVISSIASRYFAKQGTQLHTFSVDYLDNDRYFKSNKFQPDSDDHYINVMKDYLHGEHHKIIIDTPQLVDALYKSVDARDLPGMADVDASLLLFCEEVKKSATVALSGECADEIFGGYPWYRDEKIRMIDGFPWAQSTDFRASFLRDEFASQFDSHRYVNERYRATIKDTSKLPNLSDLESRMKEMMKLNLMWFMQTLLDRKDRMSMYNGLEVRVPFCDYRIAEYLYAVPWSFKDYQGREKGLLRTAMEGILPDEVLWRKKSPYPKTHHPAYLKAVSDILRDILSEPSSPLLRIVKPSALEHLLHEDSPVPWYGQLMTIPQTIAYFIQINYWLQAYHIEIV